MLPERLEAGNQGSPATPPSYVISRVCPTGLLYNI